MSDNEEKPEGENTTPITPDASPGAQNQDDPREALKQGLEATRLSPELKAQLLAEWPPPEEMERLYRELQENGGLSAEEFFESLGLTEKPAP